MPQLLRLPWSKAKNVVRVIRMQGIIKTGRMNCVNLRLLEADLDWAFGSKKIKPKAVCLEINSVGGYVVQSSAIYERVRLLSKEKGIPVLTFVEDYALSGGYWLSIAADEIYVNPSSLIGSIGTIYAQFGFQDAIAKLGIERRVIASGENKMRLDPFQSSKSSDEKWLMKILENMKKDFETVVKERRPKLQLEHPTLFTGDAFTANEAINIGLADSMYGDLREIVRSKYGKDVMIERPKIGLGQKLRNDYSQASATHYIEAMNSFVDGLKEGRFEARKNR